MRIEQIIFDCDGVLVDTEIVSAEIMVALLKSLGRKIEIKYFLSQYTGKTFREIFEDLTIDPRVDLDMLIKNVEERVYKDLRAIEGMSELARKVNLPKAVVSNSNIWQIEKALTATNLLDVFEDRFSASMVSKPKPNPDIYLHAAETLGKSPANCLAIEDSISGCTSALSAGMNVIGFCGGQHITSEHRNELTNIGVPFIANSTAELEMLLEKVIKNELDFSNS